MKEKNKKLYAVTSDQVLILDQYGSLLNIININAKKGLIINEKNLMGYDGVFLTKYNYLDFKIDTIYKTNKYYKITQYQDQLIGVLNNKSEADLIIIPN